MPVSRFREIVSVLIRTWCVAGHHILLCSRWLYYNCRAFGWYRVAPFSTKIYGRLEFAHLPIRLRMGTKCSFGRGVYLSTSRSAEIVLGEEVTFNTGCLIVASDRIEIGDRVAIGEYVSIRDQVHRFSPGQGVRGQGFDIRAVVIGENTWIGRGVFIGPGTKIGSDCIIGANSVVHGEFPSGVLIAGSPARIKKEIDRNRGPVDAEGSPAVRTG